MLNDLKEQVIDKIKCSPYFALQCDESTDVSKCFQLYLLGLKSYYLPNRCIR